MPSPALLQLANVTKTFQAPGGGEAVTVLRGVTLEVAAGESVAVVGPSGSGKSTVLNLIGALDRPDSGEINVAGQALAGQTEAQLAQYRNATVGCIFQLHHLLPQCTVEENVLVPTLVTPGRDEATLQARASELLERVGLGHRRRHRPGELSGGERQRVAVARALILKPKLLLADEPTGALDRASAERLIDLLVELNQQEGITLILVTHAQDLAQRMGRVLTLRDGQLLNA